MLNRTYSDAVPDPAEGPVLDDRFYKAMLRKFDVGICWRRELKDRLSGVNKGQFVPHHHDFVWGLPDHDEFPFEAYDGEWVKVFQDSYGWWVHIFERGPGGVKQIVQTSRYPLGDDNFADWSARMWYEIVGSGDYKHFLHGTKVERIRDPDKVRCYVSKAYRYVSKAELEACKQSIWFTGCRSWGHRNDNQIPLGFIRTISLTESVIFKLLRAFAAYIKSVSGRKRRFRTTSVFVRDTSQWIRLIAYYGGLPDEPY
jgi:hypothetical protein